MLAESRRVATPRRPAKIESTRADSTSSVPDLESTNSGGNFWSRIPSLSDGEHPPSYSSAEDEEYVYEAFERAPEESQTRVYAAKYLESQQRKRRVSASAGGTAPALGSELLTANLGHLAAVRKRPPIVLVYNVESGELAARLGYHSSIEQVTASLQGIQRSTHTARFDYVEVSSPHQHVFVEDIKSKQCFELSLAVLDGLSFVAGAHVDTYLNVLAAGCVSAMLTRSYQSDSSESSDTAAATATAASTIRHVKVAEHFGQPGPRYSHVVATIIGACVTGAGDVVVAVVVYLCRSSKRSMPLYDSDCDEDGSEGQWYDDDGDDSDSDGDRADAGADVAASRAPVIRVYKLSREWLCHNSDTPVVRNASDSKFVECHEFSEATLPGCGLGTFAPRQATFHDIVQEHGGVLYVKVGSKLIPLS